MATFVIDGITFTATAASKLPGKYGSGYNANFEDAEEDGVKKFVNAVEIDWNNAELGTVNGINLGTINSTADLMNALKALANAINAHTPETYTITWDGNGATTPASATETTVTEGNAVVLPTTGPQRIHTITWSKNGGSGTISGGSSQSKWTFKGWFTSSSGGTLLTSDDLPVPTADTTYYAQWTAPTGNVTLPSGTLTKTNYTFEGWATSSSATSANVTSNTTYASVTTNKTYYAVWKPVQSTTTYYYYAGWTLPTADNVETIITETYQDTKNSSTYNTAGKKTTSKSTMDYISNTLYKSGGNIDELYYYVLVPADHAIYDTINTNVSDTAFTLQGTIVVGNQNHKIYKFNETSRYINAIIIK